MEKKKKKTKDRLRDDIMKTILNIIKELSSTCYGQFVLQVPIG